MLFQHKTVTHGSLCSGGIDGMALGGSWVGVKTIWNCEIGEYERKLLKQEYPLVKQYKNVIDETPEEIPTIISITSECQDISISNQKGIGVFGSRSITLFDCLGICERLRPNYIIIENSAAITARGLEYLLCKLAEIGYDAEWQCLPLTAFKVQLRIQRLYLIAYTVEIGLQRHGIQTIFSERVLQEQFTRVSPGWLSRWDIPTPRTVRTTNGIANYSNRIKVIGNMIHPRAAQYLFACILNDINKQQ